MGEEGKGWSYAKFLLGHERFAIAEIARSKRRLQRLHQIARAMPDGGSTVADDPLFRDKAAALEIELLALEQMGLRVAWQMDHGVDDMLSASVLKLRGTEVIQSVTELTVEVLGYGGLSFDPAQDGAQVSTLLPEVAQGRMEEFLFLRAATIYGGSTETQKNIAARLIHAAA